MIKLNITDGPFGDSTSNYDVETDATVLAEFVEEVLKERGNEWGQFCIRADEPDEKDICLCSYRDGKVERKALNYDIYGNAKIKSIFANGGWSTMSYDIKVENFSSLPKQERDEFQIVYWGHTFNKH